MACRCTFRRSTGHWSAPVCHIKKGLIAQERARSDVRLARHDRTLRRQRFMRERAQRLVFIDETSVTSNMTRLCGRCAVGERLFGVAPFGLWRTKQSSQG
ncbi:hypothetical protein P775_24620 [Puniceibacterium antarcticum]|uniref:Tc1-like transposase DDE domain-containing protein n=1 Tax=Puniceibacterium antarcticum TaxID=1206336 RepID=A0A2G8R6Q2_9RHOB|nr:hypothetical protein P775_24620 [Puniceibacterium antarcticum]